MHHRIYLKPLMILVLAATAVQLTLAYYAIGGVDVPRYWNYSYVSDFSDMYYFKEFVSWAIIRFVTFHVDRTYMLFGVAISILLISVLSVGPWRGMILYASFLSPFGILLEFNVLRQCLGTLFLSLASFHLVNDRIKWAVFFVLLAIASHNSSVIPALGLAGAYIFFKCDLKYRIVLVATSVIFLLFLQLTGVLDIIVGEKSNSLLSNASDGPENAIYALICIMYATILYATSPSKRVISLGIATSVVAFVIMCSFFQLESWVYGRIALSGIIILSFMIFSDYFDRSGVNYVKSASTYAVLIINAALIPVHPGAMSMLG